MKRVLALAIFGALLGFGLSLAEVAPAFADIKAVVDILCDPATDTIVKYSPSGAAPAAPSTSCVATYVVLMNNHFTKENVIAHDTIGAQNCTATGCSNPNDWYHITFTED